MTEIELKQLFARDSYKAIRNILYKEHGIDNDNLARYITLLVLQETEWGKKPSGKNNYFGIKAKNNEPFTPVLTTEYIDGKKTMLKLNFRDYDSLEDGYSSFIKNLVTNYDIKNHAKSLNDYTSHVAKKYATDPEYANKLSGIYNGRTFKLAMDGYYVELPRKFSKPSYTLVEQPDALRVSKLEPYIPIPYTPKPNPIQENFWTQWSKIPYKQLGGTIRPDWFLEIMKSIGRQNYKDWGFSNSKEATEYALNDNSYNYQGFYEENPTATPNSKTHWPDTYKGVNHPTFSNESKYHGKRDKRFNPKGLRGGIWIGKKFISQPWQIPSLVINAENK